MYGRRPRCQVAGVDWFVQGVCIDLLSLRSLTTTLPSSSSILLLPSALPCPASPSLPYVVFTARAAHRGTCGWPICSGTRDKRLPCHGPLVLTPPASLFCNSSLCVGVVVFFSFFCQRLDLFAKAFCHCVGCINLNVHRCCSPPPPLLRSRASSSSSAWVLCVRKKSPPPPPPGLKTHKRYERPPAPLHPRKPWNKALHTSPIARSSVFLIPVCPAGLPNLIPI